MATTCICSECAYEWFQYLIREAKPVAVKNLQNQLFFGVIKTVEFDRNHKGPEEFTLTLQNRNGVSVTVKGVLGVEVLEYPKKVVSE